MKTFHFITVNYFSAPYIEKLIDSLQSLAFDRYRITVVNNSPADVGVAALLHKYPELTVIEAGGNLGFGGGCNLGIAAVYQQDPEALIWLINPDATLAPNAIDYVDQCLIHHPSLAILGTRIRDGEGRVWFHRGTFNPWLGCIDYYPGQPEVAADQPTVVPSRWVTGCSMILNLSQFDHCPGFDPAYFLYYEDNDFCERYFRQGYRIGVTQSVLVTHAVSSISSRNKAAKYQHQTYSRLRFLSLYGTKFALGLNLAAILGLIAFSLLRDRDRATGRWQGLRQFIQGVAHNKPEPSHGSKLNPQS
uniref:Glycosyl transferase family 2 n=1 Tax=Cyanothece sp. (strain PCC 7425 / ATCC 29141) TaxID=395961 RepID=B8HXI0_CYAP4